MKNYDFLRKQFQVSYHIEVILNALLTVILGIEIYFWAFGDT